MKWGIVGSLGLLAGFLGLILFGDKGLAELSRLKVQETDIREKNETLARENAELYSVIKRLRQDPVYIERVARTELGMVGREDQVVIFSEAAGKGK
ncbi:septum formation initiator family protein [Desulfosarcina sp. OttesenSCG-928-G10]|nr:septum formation initiator family protein [Desulfosarcina sp. OttesenSCG-928-G10]